MCWREAGCGDIRQGLDIKINKWAVNKRQFDVLEESRIWRYLTWLQHRNVEIYHYSAYSPERLIYGLILVLTDFEAILCGTQRSFSRNITVCVYKDRKMAPVKRKHTTRASNNFKLQTKGNLMCWRKAGCGDISRDYNKGMLKFTTTLPPFDYSLITSEKRKINGKNKTKNKNKTK